MMLRHEVTPRDGSPPGVLRRKSRAGTTFLGAFAGLAVLGVGTVAAALVGIHSTPALASSVCQALPTAPSSPPPGPSSSPSPGGSTSGSGSGSAAAASPAATQLCVTVTAATSTVQPGHPAQYAVTVQPTGGAATDVTVQISASPGSFPAPTFSICGSGDGTATCTLGGMRANQSTQLQAQDAVPSGASSGDSVTLTAKVTGVASGATTQGSVSGIASVRVVAPPPTSPAPTKSSSPSSSKHSHGHSHHNGGSGGHSGGSGSGGDSGVGTNLGNGLGNGLGGFGTGLGTGGTSPGSDLAPLTGLSGSGSGSDPSSLFPTINPSPGTPGTGGSPSAAGSDGRDPYHPTTVADVLPLNNGQVGGQVAGLVVLALGIIIAVVRVSVRKPRTQDKQ
jgi:hypothetical protein